MRSTSAGSCFIRPSPPPPGTARDRSGPSGGSRTANCCRCSRRCARSYIEKKVAWAILRKGFATRPCWSRSRTLFAVIACKRCRIEDALAVVRECLSYLFSIKTRYRPIHRSLHEERPDEARREMDMFRHRWTHVDVYAPRRRRSARRGQARGLRSKRQARVIERTGPARRDALVCAARHRASQTRAQGG